MTEERHVHDPISGWLEDHLRPALLTAHREFLWQYLQIYDQWARHHAAHPAISDQASLDFLTQAAEAALRGLSTDKPTRLWLSVLRSVPLPMFAHIAMINDPGHLIELIKIASTAAVSFGDSEPDMPSDQNSLKVSAEWLQNFQQRLAVDVPRTLGAAHSWFHARGWYRIAGKGGRLLPPQPVDLPAMRARLDALPPGVILLVPSAEFANHDELMPQLNDYDRRSREAGSASVTGLMTPGGAQAAWPVDATSASTAASVPAADRETDPSPPELGSWWTAEVQGLSGQQTAIIYPRQNVTLRTTSYLLLPDDIRPQMARLKAFASLMPARLGIDFGAFERCCRAVAAVLRLQTGYTSLRPLGESPGVLRFVSTLPTLDAETRASGFLYSVMHRGLLRAPLAGWVSQIASLIATDKVERPQQVAEQFVATFTREPVLDADFKPGLFLRTDPQTLALDLLTLPDFFDCCLRRLTSQDDAPTADARRGVQFEQSAWTLLQRQLPAQLVVPLNQPLNDGAVQGEIDIAFRLGDITMVLECKSWQKRLSYLRGDRASIEARHQQLQRIVDVQLARNLGLLRQLRGDQLTQDVLSFICVAGPEFVARGRPGLWYGCTQRVLTPPEIVALCQDAPRLQAVVAASRAMAGR